MKAKDWFYNTSFVHGAADNALPPTADKPGLAPLLEASPRLHQMLQDLKRLEKYMTPKEKERVVELVKKAMGAK